MFGIYKIFGTTVQLQKFYTKVSINKRTMIIHTLLLALQSLVVIVNTLVPYIQFFYNHAHLITIIVTVVDLIVQLMICYICLSMGSHAYLRKFQITLDLTTGVSKVVFKRIRESVRDSLFDSEIETDKSEHE